MVKHITLAAGMAVFATRDQPMTETATLNAATTMAADASEAGLLGFGALA